VFEHKSKLVEGFAKKYNLTKLDSLAFPIIIPLKVRGDKGVMR
jgi:hypothetical protein